MQRLFSTFANGWPGIGILMQRLVLGAIFFHGGIVQFGISPSIATLFLSLIEGIAGMLLAAGLWTPIAGVLAAVTEIWSIGQSNGDKWIAISLAIFTASLSMIGPGAWSLDARLFGRKKMDIPER